MSNKTIAKFCTFVISICLACGFFSACSPLSSGAVRPAPKAHYGEPKINGKIAASEITESSGIAASRCQPGVLWTHNDSGDGPYIFAIDGSGRSLGTWKVTGAQNIDWEDIASYKDKNGKCELYIGETGDNKARRGEHAIYRVSEPVVSPSDSTSDRQRPMPTEPANILRFSYPDYMQDAETLMVHPGTGDIYVLTKRISGPAGVYRLKANVELAAAVKIEKVTEISVPAIPNGLLTGGDISPDGRRVILCDYTQAYELRLPDASTNFDDIWGQEPEPVDLGKRAAGEAVSYKIDGTSIFATSEKKHSPVIEVAINK